MSLLALRSGGEQKRAHAPLPRSIVPSASISSSAGLDSQGFLIGQAGPGGHPVTSPPAVHGDGPLPGVGDVPGKLGLSSTKDWEPASYPSGPPASVYPTQVVSSTLSPLQAAPTGKQSSRSGELAATPQMDYSIGTRCPDLGE